MSTRIDEVLLRSVAAAQRVEVLANQLAELAIALRDETGRLNHDHAALRERMMRLETLIDASMLFSLRDRQAARNTRDPKETDPPPDDGD